MNRDQDRLRHDVWANFALTNEDEASLGIPNFGGQPNNPFYNTSTFFKNYYDSKRRDLLNNKFKIPQHRQVAESIVNNTYQANIH